MNVAMPEHRTTASLPDDLAQRLSADAVLRHDESLAHRTTLRVGGPADYYVEPGDEADLTATLSWCAEHEQPWMVIGRGSNLLVRDGGVRGVVLCLCRPFFSRIECNENSLSCGAGAKLRQVAIEARRRGLAGMEFLEGIPGSVGGGLRMNAGAMGGQVFDHIVTVRSMDSEGRIEDQKSSSLGAGYRHCPALVNRIALSAVFRGRPDSVEAIGARMDECSRKRWASQPAAPSAGCIFKNPLTIPAGRLIDELGLKGTSVGMARVSMEHGNFIVTQQGATAAQVLELIEIIRVRALKERGIELETEVRIIGT
jgi:UDP-N-acetylenolpyruvoylglucosamine reductase